MNATTMSPCQNYYHDYTPSAPPPPYPEIQYETADTPLSQRKVIYIRELIDDKVNAHDMTLRRTMSHGGWQMGVTSGFILATIASIPLALFIPKILLIAAVAFSIISILGHVVISMQRANSHADCYREVQKYLKDQLSLRRPSYGQLELDTTDKYNISRIFTRRGYSQDAIAVSLNAVKVIY